MTKKTKCRFAKTVVLIGSAIIIWIIMAVIQFSSRVSAEYGTAAAIRDLIRFVEENDGKWPGSAAELGPRYVNGKKVLIDYSVSSEELVQCPERLKDVVQPNTGNFTVYLYYDEDLEKLLYALKNSRENAAAKAHPIFQLRTSQMGGELRDRFPDRPEDLFRGGMVKIDLTIKNREDHLEAIATIPKKLLAGHRLTKTVEVDGWFYTSVVYKGFDKNSDTDWFQVIGTKKGEPLIYFSHSW